MKKLIFVSCLSLLLAGTQAGCIEEEAEADVPAPPTSEEQLADANKQLADANKQLADADKRVAALAATIAELRGALSQRELAISQYKMQTVVHWLFAVLVAGGVAYVVYRKVPNSKVREALAALFNRQSARTSAAALRPVRRPIEWEDDVTHRISPTVWRMSTRMAAGYALAEPIPQAELLRGTELTAELIGRLRYLGVNTVVVAAEQTEPEPEPTPEPVPEPKSEFEPAIA